MNSLRAVAAIVVATLVGSIFAAGAASAATAPNVLRLSGSSRYATAAEVSKQFYPAPRYTFIATGENFPDALAGAAWAGSRQSPLLLTPSRGLSAHARAELERLQPHEIVLLGGEDVVSADVEAEVAQYAASGVVTRVAGSSRYRTADKISEQYPAGTNYAFIATGENFPDALSAAALAGKLNAPLLLVRGEGIPEGTKQELARLKPGKIIVIGGTNVVSDRIFNQLSSYATANTADAVTRIAGPNRYETSRLIAQKFETSSDIYIATGEDFPDALAGAALAGATDSALMLTRKVALPASSMEEIEQLGATTVYLLGGPNVISGAVRDQITSGSRKPVTRRQVVSWNGEDATLTTTSLNSTPMYDNGFEFELVRKLYRDNNRARFPVLAKGIGLPNPDGSTPYSVKSSIAPGGYTARSEVINTYDADMYTQQAFGYSMYVPKDQRPPVGNQWSLFSQLKQTNCGVPPIAFHWTPNVANSSEYFEFEIRIQNDVTGWRPTPDARIIYKGKMPKGQWNRLAMTWVSSPSNPNNAYFNFWLNGELQSTPLPAGEAIGYTEACTEYAVPMSFNLRTGIYRGGAYWEQEGVTYFDNMKFGSTYADVQK